MIGLEDLLANYGAGTFENTNMMVANDGSGNLKRVDDVQGTIRRLTEETGLERDYNQSFRQHVARLIQHINNEENKNK